MGRIALPAGRSRAKSFHPMSIEHLLLLYTLTTLGIIALVALLTELRGRSFNPRPSEDRVFRCDDCSYVYTDDADVDRSRCPQCGTFNDAVRF